jgi:hypothetical protein
MADSDVPFAVVHLPPKGGGGLVFAADSGDTLQVLHETTLGQREVCRIRLCLSGKEKGSCIQQIERLADRLDAFNAMKSPGMRHWWSLFLCPSTKTGPGMTIWDFSA